MGGLAGPWPALAGTGTSVQPVVQVAPLLVCGRLAGTTAVRAGCPDPHEPLDKTTHDCLNGRASGVSPPVIPQPAG
jgi:hypothetical protein